MEKENLEKMLTGELKALAEYLKKEAPHIYGISQRTLDDGTEAIFIKAGQNASHCFYFGQSFDGKKFYRANCGEEFATYGELKNSKKHFVIDDYYIDRRVNRLFKKPQPDFRADSALFSEWCKERSIVADKVYERLMKLARDNMPVIYFPFNVREIMESSVGMGYCGHW